MSLPDEDTISIDVYRDHPEFDRVDRWWMIRLSLLEELHVASYDVPCEDGYPVDLPGCVAAVRALHPGCILVYIDL